METYQDKANTLAQRFGISPVEAMKAVEECDGDILDAVSLLECKGVIRRTSASYRSGGQKSGQTYQGSAGGNNYIAPNNGGNNVYGFDYGNSGNIGGGKDIKSRLAKLLALSIEYKLAAVKNDRTIISLPIIAVIVLLICAFWFIIPAAVIGFFAGCRYEIVK